MRIIIAFLLLADICLFPSCKTESSQEIRDDFETDSLSPVWSNSKFIPGALEIQSEIVHTGNKAARLVLKHGDQIAEETGTIFERAELREPKKMMAKEQRKYTYAFSLFLPVDFPKVPTRLVIAQWKQNCSGNCDPDNPVIALRYDSGVFRITLQTGPERVTLYSRDESIIASWMNFRFDVKFSRNSDGYLIAWLNNEKIIDFKGVTAYSEAYGYPAPGDFYFKMGLYRDTMAETMTIYIDDYLKKEMSE